MKTKQNELDKEYTLGEAKYVVSRIFGDKNVKNIIEERFTIQNIPQKIELTKK